MTKRIIIGSLVALSLIGCAGETGVRLSVRTNISVPDDMDAVTVTVFSGPPAPTLFSETRTFRNIARDDFPLTVGVKPGSIYDEWVMFHVEGILTNRVITDRWVVAKFVDGEITEVLVELQSACVGVPCGGGEECLDGVCQDAARPEGWTHFCGDGVFDSPEECDEGTQNSDTRANACRTDCASPSCGDDVVDTGEQCDDGNTTSDDGCSATCQNETARCGDHVVNGIEECDDGNATADDGCEADCTFSCASAANCDDTNVCTTDTCDHLPGPIQRCANAPVTAGTDCDDTNACTDGEACNAAGLCTGGTNICTCDPVDPPTTCETENGDNNPCNGTLRCTTAEPHVCEVDPATIRTEGATCDDTLFCNGADTCVGTDPATRDCTGHGVDPCVVACQTCDDTADECDITTGFCFIVATCYAGAALNPDNDCQGCVAATSQTAWTDLVADTTCDDGDDCTSGDVCDGSGACAGTGACDCLPTDDCEGLHGDDDPCNGTLICGTTTYTCDVDPTTLTYDVDDPCDDGLACNGADTCQDPGTGLECTPPGVSPCLSCETCAEGATRCTRNDMFCIIGGTTCYARGDHPTGNICQVCDDAADPIDWSDEPNTVVCDDLLFCNGSDHCDGLGACADHGVDPCASTTCRTCVESTASCDINTGSCYIGSACYASGAPNPANPCEVCDTATPTVWSNAAAGTACNDTDPCTHSDACTTGTCAGTAGCTTPALVQPNGRARFCITDSVCDAAAGAACTSVNVPGSFNTWGLTADPMSHCATGAYWVATAAALTAGPYCYRFYLNGATWLSPAGGDCGTGATYCDPPTDTYCRFTIP